MFGICVGRRARLGMAAMLAVLLFGITGAAAEERKLTAAEISALLTGNTALGENRGRDTRQYFAATGRTDYLERGGQVDPGKWRVDEAQNKYCSLWARGGWACYDIVTDGEAYFWVAEGYRSPFSMIDGRNLSF